jgi:hypothetical protein
MDRLQPLIQNVMTNGGTETANDVSRDRVLHAWLNHIFHQSTATMSKLFLAERYSR